MAKKCVLVMNGSFNPPTVAHLSLLTMARNKIEDEGYTVVRGLFVPTNGGYDKPGLANPKQRVEMCRMTAAVTDWIDVEPHDTEQEKWCPVVETLAYIQKKYPDCRLFFVCGADLVLRWNEPVWPPEQVTEIVTKYGVIAASRLEGIEAIIAKVPVLKGKEEFIHLITFNPLSEVSSTVVRNLLKEHKLVTGMLIPDVEKYVTDNHIYA